METINTKKQYTEAKKYFNTLINEATEKGYLNDTETPNEYTEQITKLGKEISRYERKNIDFGVFNTPILPPHPSETIREEMEEQGLNQVQLSELMNIPKSQLNEILTGKRNINASVSVKLESVFNIPAEFWLKLQAKHDIAKIKANESNEVKKLNRSRNKSQKHTA